jgi:urea carboxylase-associated protein 1
MVSSTEKGVGKDVAGTIMEDVIVEAGQPWGRLVKKGEHVRIIDLKGRQAVDFLCYSAADPQDRYNAPNTMKLGRNIFLSKGSSLWSDRAKKLMTIVEDTCGSHDTIGGCCSSEMNLLRYQKTASRNCRDTFEEALKQFGMTRADIATNINWFMYVPVKEDGSMAIVEGLSKAGDFVELVADQDVICVASNCAQIYNPCNGFDPTPVRIVTYSPD